jgi:hypothetical protein
MDICDEQEGGVDRLPGLTVRRSHKGAGRSKSRRLCQEVAPGE